MTVVIQGVKERPILFKGEMVRAILEGRKTQTRRIVKGADQNCDGLVLRGDHWQMVWNKSQKPDGGLLEIVNISCPYGKVGDRLWVRETWRPRAWGNDFDWMIVEFAADGDSHGEPIEINPWEVWGESRAEEVWESLSLECSHAKLPQDGDGRYLFSADQNPLRWHPSIFMPRAVSRIALEITDVRVERLQSISEEDAIAEGVTEALSEDTMSGCSLNTPLHGDKYFARWAFKYLWDDINAKTHPWATNPWVWCISFRRVD